MIELRERRAENLLPRDDRVRNLVWGVTQGLLFAGVLCAFVAIASMLRGSTYYARYDLTLAQVVSIYLVSGAAAGAVVGLLRNWTVTLGGAMVVGFFAAIPVALAVYGSSQGSPLRWSQGDWDGVYFFCAVMGPATGFIRWKQSRGDGDPE